MKKILFPLVIIISVVLLMSLPRHNKSKVENVLDVLAKIAAAGSLLGLMYQFYREKNIKEAEFILQLNQTFIQDESMARIYKLLEESKAESQENEKFSDDDIIDMANYLTFFDPFYDLLKRGILKIETINLFAYRFFLAVHNEEMQRKLLCKKGKESAWLDIYKLYEKWKKYREKRDMVIYQRDFALDKCSIYQEVMQN
jgi:hypothetical protein